jgi:hypothetical protein
MFSPFFSITTLSIPSGIIITGTCFIQKIYAPSSSLLQGKHLPFTPSSLRLNIIHLFVILSLTVFMSWRSVLLMEKIIVPGENHRPVASH